MPRQKLLNGFVDMFVCLCLCVCACLRDAGLFVFVFVSRVGMRTANPVPQDNKRIDILAISRMLCVYTYIYIYISYIVFILFYAWLASTN